MTRVGFTGSQVGMTADQLLTLTKILRDLQPDEFHHGDCVGADHQAHILAHALGIRIVIHPPVNETRRAFCLGAAYVLPPQDYLTRNHAIVRATDRLIATPSGPETLRSGTWATVRYARKAGKRIHIVLPDEQVTTEKENG